MWWCAAHSSLLEDISRLQARQGMLQLQVLLSPPQPVLHQHEELAASTCSEAAQQFPPCHPPTGPMVACSSSCSLLLQ